MHRRRTRHAARRTSLGTALGTALSAALPCLLALSGSGQAVAGEAAAPNLVHSFGAVTVSPDGARIAAIEADEPADPAAQRVMRLVVRDTATGTPSVVALPCGDVADCKPAEPAFSPDGRSLVFLLQDRTGSGAGSAATAKPPHRPPHWQIERADADGRNVSALLSFDGTLQTPRFSPDGRLAVLAVAAARKESGATAAAAARSALP